MAAKTWRRPRLHSGDLKSDLISETVGKYLGANLYSMDPVCRKQDCSPYDNGLVLGEIGNYSPQDKMKFIASVWRPDEAADVSNKENISIVIRFLDTTKTIREEFIGYYLCEEETTGEAIKDIIIPAVGDLGLTMEDCRGQCYEGAGNMARRPNGASSLIRAEHEKAIRLVRLPNGLSKTFWPRYRGKRAGRLVKDRGNDRYHLISVAQPRDPNRVATLTRLHRSRNPANLILVTISPTIPKGGLSSTYVPSFLVSNVMSLAPKIDELRHVVQNANLDCICITESWLRSSIHDNVVGLEGFNIIRRDRVESEHGGVCMYIKDTSNFTGLAELQKPSFEMLWVKLRPFCLPRGCNFIVVGTLYHPPSASDPAIMEYLIKCLSTIESYYPNCGILLAGDFNRLQITRLRNNFQLKQMVHFPTRGRRTLDLVLTNISEYYQDPIERPPFGLSDHASIELQPKERAHVKQPTITIKTRVLRPSKCQAMGAYLAAMDVNTLTCALKTCAEKVSLLEQIIKTGLDHIRPIQSRRVHFTEPPWITSTLKDLI
ncbi:hypothetical protein AWC38_SpisGene20057 [Stylophora pistillata]|uniref:Uncharacterized protein n=1 Tax=Stylophora pistillata TaxID=50429 RepID=A0A2B4RFW1_STYPI|nr:hypothetical protein AWC38_SpisGene20057 [Stylophora pistillata]